MPPPPGWSTSRPPARPAHQRLRRRGHPHPHRQGLELGRHSPQRRAHQDRLGTLEIAGAGSNTNTSLVAAAGTTLLNATTRAVYEIRALDTGATVRLGQANQVFNGDALPTTGNIRMTGGTLDLDGNAQEISRMIGSTNATAGTGTITSSSPATFTVGNSLAGRPSIFDGSLTGALAVVTRGTNPITLGGASSYTGTTTVGGSRLAVNGSLGNTAVTVTAGTLGGSGSIAGTVAVQNGATLAPGNSIESLSAGATSFASGATFAYEVDSTARQPRRRRRSPGRQRQPRHRLGAPCSSFTDLNPSPAALSKTPRSSPSSTTRAPGTVACLPMPARRWPTAAGSASAASSGRSTTTDHGRPQLHDRLPPGSSS